MKYPTTAFDAAEINGIFLLILLLISPSLFKIYSLNGFSTTGHPIWEIAISTSRSMFKYFVLFKQYFLPETILPFLQPARLTVKTYFRAQSSAPLSGRKQLRLISDELESAVKRSALKDL